MSSEVTMPTDFAVVYTWQAGSMPPPYHYEFTIHIGPQTKGKIVFFPDYPSDDTPRWTEIFPVDEQLLSELHGLIMENDLQRREWPEEQIEAIGGSQEWLEITASGKTVKLPSRASSDEMAAAAYAFIRRLVPESIWAELLSRREQYEREYEDRAE
jgi:hypothetical protein